MKIIVIIAFAAIIGSLGFALLYMLKDGTGNKPKTNKMFKALAFRVGFSVLVFLCILISWKFGWIQPTGIPRGA
jgi:Trk-type K+ transport system membrane component